MARADITLPTIGLPITTEDPKVIAALTALEASVNNIEAEQITTAVTEFRVFEAVEAWQSVSLNATYFGAASLFFYKDIMGVVRFRGDAYTLSSDINGVVTVATLPSTHRPDATARGVVTQYGGGAKFSLPIVVNTNGTVVVSSTLSVSSGPMIFSVQFRGA